MAAAGETEKPGDGDGKCIDSGNDLGACKAKIDFNVTFDRCLICCLLHDSPEFGPYCEICHTFLYPDAIAVAAKEGESADTEEVESLHTTFDSSEVKNGVGKTDLCYPGGVESEDSGCESENSSACSSSTDLPETTNSNFKLPYLSLYERVRSPFLIAERLAAELHVVEDDVVESMPPEILLMIFSNLDDISLCMAGQVCQRWRVLAGEPDQWKTHVSKRWPLLRPAKPVKCWRTLYLQLLQSVSCRRCFEEGCIQHSPENDLVNTWRNKRLRSELKSLLVDPPDGIRAMPLDNSYSHWQASITGPPDSPYDSGLFFLHLEIPKSYPMRPPIVRFVTRIFHPNVSYHGDVGLDALRHNWSLALTIPKVLVSIQSLLTDPYCHICMEPDVAKLCAEDKEEFERVSQDWTLKYARLHIT